MSKTRIYINLSNRVNSRNVEVLSSFLAQYNDLDVTHDEGALLTSAIANDTKYGGTSTTQLLLNYYETVQLPKLTVGSIEYALLKLHLKSAVEIAIEGETLSDEMTLLLSPYISTNLIEYSSESSVHNSQSTIQQGIHDHDAEYHDSNKATCNTNIECDIGPTVEDEILSPPIPAPVRDSEIDEYNSHQDIPEYHDIRASSHSSTAVARSITDEYNVLTSEIVSTVPTSHKTVYETVCFDWDVSNKPQAIRLRQIGDEYQKSQDLDSIRKAEDCYKESIEYDSRYYPSYRKLGNLCLLQKRDIEATEYYIKAIEYKKI